MKIIIAGCGKVGTTLAETLNDEGHDITMIDLNSKVVQNVANSLDIMGVEGNAGSYSVQMEAGIESADLLIAVTNSDELNLLCCLIAKKAGGCDTIARVRNPIYNKEIGFIKKELGLSLVINPELAAATEIARILRFPMANKIDSFAKGRVEILKYYIEESSELAGLKVMDILQKLRCDVLVCAVERGDDVVIPNGTFRLEARDTISIAASPGNLNTLFKILGVDIRRVKNTMIIGGSKIAYYLSRQLLEMGISVKIIEKDNRRCEELSELLPKAIIINGDATDQEVLMEEDISHVESFAALTDFDEENIMLSLFAKSVSKAKLVTKVKRMTFEHVISILNIGSVISPKHITANYILQHVRAMQNTVGSNVETLHKIIGDKVEALEFYVREKSPIIGIPLENMILKKNLLITCITRNGSVIIPRGQDMIKVGDGVIVVTTNIGLSDIKDILE